MPALLVPPRPLKRYKSFDDMAERAKNFFHGHHPHLHRVTTSKSSSKLQIAAEEYQQRKEDEKHFIAQWESGSQEPLSPSQICRDPSEKKVGHSSKSLERKDFKLVTTIGTGTFARVWLAKLASPRKGDEDKCFALKILKKVDIIKLRQIEHVNNERSVLASVAGHPFITTMVASFQDADHLYMILDYCPGGEIFSYLRRNRRFDESTAQFYAAEIALILEFLHEREGVAYRDLKPENILLDAEGHIKLVDFGFAKKLDGRQTYTLCGTPEYLAPETIRNAGRTSLLKSLRSRRKMAQLKNSGHGNPVDWWAFGILIFEFLVGQPPFWDNNPMKTYEQIVKGKINYPSGMSEDAKDLIGKLCEVDPSKRLGNLRGGAKDVKSHPWFKNVDWEKLYKRDDPGPIIPHLKSNDDTRNFEDYDTEPERKGVYSQDMRKKYDAMFETF